MNMLIKGFKQFFIPHKHNDYKPHFFREASVVTIAIVAIVLFSFSASTKFYIENNNMTATVLPAVLVDLTNDARTSNNGKALIRNPVLDNAARLKAENMASLGYFAHTSPQGLTPWYWFNQAGYTFTYAGENLAIDFTESVDVENAWLASPTHKANILNNNFTEIGIATVDAVYQGRPTTYVVQMFGKPAASYKNITELQIQPKKDITPEQIVDKKQSTLPATVALAPGVRGESVTTEKNLETITETKDFIAVRNNIAEAKDELSSVTPTEYSSWSQRLVFMLPSYTDQIYRIFIWIVLIALIGMTIIEIKRQHPKNIMYGILLLIIITCLIYINKAMFITSFLA